MDSLRRVALAVAAAVFSASPAAASEALRAELAELAKSVQAVLAEEKQTAVAVGDFTGPPQLDSQFGPGIQQGLSDELTRLGVSVNRKAELSVTGNYADTKDPVAGEEQVVVKINARILARNGDELLKLSQKLTPRKVRDNATIAQIAGATVSLPPAGDRQTRNDSLKKALDDPKVFLRGARASATADSPFGVEVLVPSAGPRTPTVADGQAAVAVARDEVYEVKLYNDAPHEAAVAVSIDGVDVFAFSEDKNAATGRPRFTHYVVGPKSVLVVKGWHVTNDKARADNVLSFKVTELGKGAATKLGATGKIGVITATFSACGEHPPDLPQDDGARGGPGNETGFGPPQKVGLREVKRSIGVAREVISVRYTK